MKYRVTILASGLGATFDTLDECEYWAEVVKGLGKSSYRIQESLMDANGWHDAATCEERISALRESHARLLAIAKRAARCMNNDWPVKQDLVAAISEAEKVSKP